MLYILRDLLFVLLGYRSHYVLNTGIWFCNAIYGYDFNRHSKFFLITLIKTIRVSFYKFPPSIHCDIIANMNRRIPKSEHICLLHVKKGNLFPIICSSNLTNATELYWVYKCCKPGNELQCDDVTCPNLTTKTTDLNHISRAHIWCRLYFDTEKLTGENGRRERQCQCSDLCSV